jgi:hypothetical protein
MVGSICDIVWDIYIVLFHKMGFGHQEDVYFLGVEKYFYFFCALGQPICIPRRYVVYVNYFTNLLSLVVRRFMSMLICSACLDKIVSNLVKDSCTILISVCSCVLFAVIVGISLLFMVAWAYVIFSRPSVLCGCAGHLFSCRSVYVIRILAVVRGEGNFVHMIFW